MKKGEGMCGEVCHSIDEKGRITIPNQYRDMLGEGFVVTRGLDHCLWMMTREEWEAVEAEIKGLDHNIREVRIYARFILGGACDGELDKQGRMMIPQSLREYAELEKEALFSRGPDYVEIWSRSRYGGWMNDDEISMSAARISELRRENMRMG